MATNPNFVKQTSQVGGLLQGGNPTGTQPAPFVGPVRPAPSQTTPTTTTVNTNVIKPQPIGTYKYADDPTVFRSTDNYGFRTWQEFLGAGGDPNNIEIRSRPSSITLPGGNYDVNPATGAALKNNKPGLSLPPVDIFSLKDLQTATTSPTSASAITNFLTQLQTQRQQFQQSLMASQVPTQGEVDIETALNQLRGNADQLMINTQAGADQMQQQPIAQQLIEGQQGALFKQSQLSLQTMARQEQTLLGRLGIEQNRRQAGAKVAELGLSFLDQESATFFQAQEAYAKEEDRILAQADRLTDNAREVFATILDKFMGLDIEDLDPQTQQQLATLATQAGIPLNVLVEGMKVNKDQMLFENQIKQGQLMASLNKNGDPNSPLSVDDLKKLSDLGYQVTPGMTYGDVRQLSSKGSDPAQQAQIKSTIEQISNLVTQTDSSNAVGPNALSRLNLADFFTSAKSNFIADVQQLTDQLTLSKLINAKAQGATFGALSEGELNLLASSGSKISSWAVKDKDGKVTGYKTTVKDFNAEMDKISNFARLDYILKGGNPEDVGIQQLQDGTWASKNSDGSYNEFDELQPSFKSAGKPQASTGMRTDRHNNPTAFTVNIAKQAGLQEGVDYVTGDPFPNNPNEKTAKLLGDPISQTINVIDKIGFYTPSGKPRWSYIGSIPQAQNWKNLNTIQKKNIIAQMYKHEGGSALSQYFA